MLHSCGHAASGYLFCICVPEHQARSVMPRAAENDYLGRPAVQVVKKKWARPEGARLFTR
jgi:hypothetical protein